MEASRLRNSTAEVMNLRFDEVEAQRTQEGYDKGDVWNMDETGYGLGKGARERALVCVKDTEKLALQRAKQRSGAGKQGHEWVTTIEGVSVAGRALSPVVIFKGAKLVDIDAQDDG
jgi:hypothetical protein